MNQPCFVTSEKTGGAAIAAGRIAAALRERAVHSSLIDRHQLLHIPNPIDTDFFKPVEKKGPKGRVKNSFRLRQGFRQKKRHRLFHQSLQHPEGEASGIEHQSSVLRAEFRSPVFKETGYVAEYKSSEDLAAGIGWVLEDSDYGRLSEASRQKVLKQYSEEKVAAQYVRLYQSLK